MQVEQPESVPTAFSKDHLADLIEANEFGPPITDEQLDRVIELLCQRNDATAFDDVDDVLVMSTWNRFCEETFGKHDHLLNRFAFGRPNWKVSHVHDAYLFEHGASIQQGWLESGDGRMRQLEQIDCTDTRHVDEVGTFWAPKEYVAVFAISAEMLSDAKACDAM